MARKYLLEEEIDLILEGDVSGEDDSEDELDFDDILKQVQNQVECFGEADQFESEIEYAEHLGFGTSTMEQQQQEELQEDQPTTSRNRLRWQKRDLLRPSVDCNTEENSCNGSILTPFQYFQMFYSQNIIESMAYQTNLYAVQNDPANPIDVSEGEISTFLGILLLSGIISVPSYRMYWANATRVNAIADVMPRNRFEKIKRNLHFNDNSAMKQRTEEGYDKLFKVRPILDAVRENLLKLKPEEHNAVDETLIPCKSRNSIIQYLRNKPHKWGVKIFSRCGASGILYDFHVYTGKDPRVSTSELGISGGIVMKLCETLPKHENFKIYTDNWFSSYKLACKLKEDGFHTIGCVRSNRLPGCVFETDKSMKKRGRGSFDFRVERSENIIAVKWYDNKPIHMLSTFEGVDEIAPVQRWSAKDRGRISIPRPKIVATYNSYMGGVDLSDMLVALYRTSMGTKKFYMRIFHYFLDVSVVNAWLIYRKCCLAVNTSQNKILKLIQFRAEISQVLLQTSNLPHIRKRGRPSESPLSIRDDNASTSRRRTVAPPVDVVRTHNFHLPKQVEKKQRCFYCKDRKSFSRTICVKCNKAFCLTTTKQCFFDFHTKTQM